MTNTNYTQPNSLLQFFQYAHLPEHLQEVSKKFADLAQFVDIETADDNSQASIALQKLLEAKDCAVRAFLQETNV